jgi:serine/threonine-protein kinase
MGAGGQGGRGGSNAAGSGGGSDKCFAKPLFSAQMAWNQPVDTKAKDAQSDTIVAALQNRGWGNNGVMQIDFSLDVLCADASTPRREFQPTDEFYEGECDFEAVPVPNGGHLEGESGYQCTTGGDCHLIVVAQDTNKLYEQWRVNIEGSDFQGGCLAVWQLDRSYGPGLRGDQCTSADAAGLPIAPLLFDADEVAGGAIEHAIRFAIPNTHIRNNTYVRPGSHATGAAKAGADGVPYGARLRLRADYPLDDLPNAGARVVARALQRYGMILADGGNIALMGQDDRGTTAKWDGLLEPRDLDDLKPRDFELVEAGERFTWTGDCVLED